jgi:hypothetical protein
MGMTCGTDKAKRLWSSDFGKELHKAVCAYCLPVFWASRNGGGAWEIRNNGTAFILSCGAEPFVVTAAHVYEGFLEAQVKEELRSWLGPIQFRMDERVLGYVGAKKLDVATFHISAQELEETGKSVLYGNQTAWPPARVTAGLGALFAGFPGNQRIGVGPLKCSFGLYSAFSPVSSVSDRHFGCAFDRTEWIDTMGKSLPEEGFDLGGISGCPVLAVDESPAGVLSWHLAGIGYSSSSALGEIFLAHHADSLRHDGSLIHEA